MTVTVFHGSPRKGNTYRAVKLFMDELQKCGEVKFTEFYLPADLPEFCTGCQLCLSDPNVRCPHSQYVIPILDSIISSDALIFATPHYGACSMSSGMKNLLDHLDFLTLNIFPREEMFSKKAFIITTGSGSAAAIKPIESFLKNWGVNRVYSVGLRMFTNTWDAMTEARQRSFEKRLRRAARKFYGAPKCAPYLSSMFMYYMSRFIMRKYVGPGAAPYEYWKEKGYFKKRPF